MKVRISAASMRQLFHSCTPEFIRDVCHASCCESSSAPGGTMVTIHPCEETRIRELGGVVKDGLLQSTPAKRCPFKTEANLCGLHGTSDKPFGCIASPFTLSKGANPTLIVRNRYRLLKCFRAEGAVKVYRAHRGSLDLLFGAELSASICQRLDEQPDEDFEVDMDDVIASKLMTNDEIKRRAKGEPPPLTDEEAKERPVQLPEPLRKIEETGDGAAVKCRAGTSSLSSRACASSSRTRARSRG